MTRLAAICLLTGLLSGCGAAPWWASIASGTLSWVASANNLGTELIKVHEEKKQAPPQEPQAP